MAIDGIQYEVLRELQSIEDNVKRGLYGVGDDFDAASFKDDLEELQRYAEGWEG